MTENEGYDNDQLKFREQHGVERDKAGRIILNGLVWDTVRSGQNLVELRKRDGWQAKLWGSLTEHQQKAMEEIETAFRAVTGGIGMKTMNPEALSGKALAHETERQAQRIADYFIWGRELNRLHLSHAMAMAIIVEGRSGKDADEVYRQRNGTAMGNLRASLNVFCELRGWPTER